MPWHTRRGTGFGGGAATAAATGSWTPSLLGGDSMMGRRNCMGMGCLVYDGDYFFLDYRSPVKGPV